MKYDSISIEPIYTSIKKMHGNPIKAPPLPKRGAEMFTEFTSVYETLLSSIDCNRAVYLWYSAKHNEENEYIYVGITKKDKAGLRGRLEDHFNQGYHIFWMTAFATNQYIDESIKLYTGIDYTRTVNNQALRNGVTHIVYCSDIPDDINIEVLEKDLIQLFGNPRGNVRGKRKRPLPPEKLLPISVEIYNAFVQKVKNTSPYSI
ncbi:MAG: hypothetical protein HY964_08265 [Ignavibacteriales bacterium]|nr:hypothetical protein [Ignavibacteriales bacterium]